MLVEINKRSKIYQKRVLKPIEKNFYNLRIKKNHQRITDCPIPCSSFFSIYEITIFTCFFGSCFLILSVSLLKLILVCSSSDLVGVALLLDISLFLFCSEWNDKNYKWCGRWRCRQIGREFQLGEILSLKVSVEKRPFWWVLGQVSDWREFHWVSNFDLRLRKNIANLVKL